jgi:hypothetical protein
VEQVGSIAAALHQLENVEGEDSGGSNRHAA